MPYEFALENHLNQIDLYLLTTQTTKSVSRTPLFFARRKHNILGPLHLTHVLKRWSALPSEARKVRFARGDWSVFQSVDPPLTGIHWSGRPPFGQWPWAHWERGPLRKTNQSTYPISYATDLTQENQALWCSLDVAKPPASFHNHRLAGRIPPHLEQVAKHQIPAGRRLFAQPNPVFARLGAVFWFRGRHIVAQFGGELDGLHEIADELVEMLAALLAQLLGDWSVDGEVIVGHAGNPVGDRTAWGLDMGGGASK